MVTVCWFAASFNYYMVTFLFKYYPGDIFVNTSISAFSDIWAVAISGAIYNKLGPKLSLRLFFGLSSAAGCLIVLYEHSIGQFTDHPTEVSSMLFPMLVLVSQFGISAAFNTLFIANGQLFPVLFAATAQGISNFVARFSSSFSP